MNNVYHDHRVVKPSVPLSVVLVLACTAQLMVVLDGLIVNVALPQMQADLRLSAAAQPWIVNGYLISLGGLLLLAARAADLVGQRRVVLAGLAVFTLASLAGGLAPDATTLLAARVVQGVGAAALATSSLSLLTTTHTGGHRARAVSIWSATSASAGALGLVLGGVITSGLGWRWVLLVNVPIGVALWILASVTLLPARTPDRPPLDLRGAVSITLGVGALTYGITQVGAYGWLSGQVIVPLLVAAALLLLFVRAERRSPDPLIPLSVLRRRDVVVANSIVAALGAVMTAVLYFLSLYLQRVLGYSPVRTGLALVPMSAVLAIGAIASRSLLPRFGTRAVVITGSLGMTVGLLWLATISAHSSFGTHLLGPTLLWAAGASIVTMPCVVLATASIDVGHAGLASGLVNTARQIGGAVGLVGLATVAGVVTARSSSLDGADRVVHGYGVALVVAAVLSVLMALLALRIRPGGGTAR